MLGYLWNQYKIDLENTLYIKCINNQFVITTRIIIYWHRLLSSFTSMITSFLRSLTRELFVKNTPILIGRWTIDYDKNIQERKVYLTNMDHCGCCGNIKMQSKQPNETPDTTKVVKNIV